MSIIPKDTNLFVLDLEYLVPLAQVDVFAKAHVEFLDRVYADGSIIMSGPKAPRTGGVIIAIGSSKDEVAAVFHQDPFHTEGVARYTMTEFVPRKAVAGMKSD